MEYASVFEWSEVAGDQQIVDVGFWVLLKTIGLDQHRISFTFFWDIVLEAFLLIDLFSLFQNKVAAHEREAVKWCVFRLHHLVSLPLNLCFNVV